MPTDGEIPDGLREDARAILTRCARKVEAEHQRSDEGVYFYRGHCEGGGRCAWVWGTTMGGTAQSLLMPRSDTVLRAQ